MLDQSIQNKKIDELKLHEGNENWNDDKSKSDEMKYQNNSNGIYEDEEDEIFEDHKKEGI